MVPVMPPSNRHEPQSARGKGRVLITGASGFTGRYMSQELQAHGWAPVALQANLLDAQALHDAVQQAQPMAVVHLAAVAFVAHGEAEDFYRVNVVGTRNLLAALAALSQPLQRVLLASSANVYGNTAAGLLGEDTPLNPANDYAVSKAAMEMMARLWIERLPIVITRPFNYTGAGQAEQFLVPKIVAHFRQRAAEIELGNLQVWRDFSDVRQIVAIYRRLLELPKLDSGSVFNVGSQRLHSLGDILALAQELTGHQMQVRVNPAFVRANEVRELRADTSRLRASIGQFEPIALRETLQWMLRA